MLIALLIAPAAILLGPWSLEALCFDRQAVANGEYWRLITGHFTHSSFSHAGWDSVAFAGSLFWLGMYSKRAILPALLAGMLGVNGLLLSGMSTVSYYCGLSGLLFAPLVVAACWHAHSVRGVGGWAPLVAIAGKVLLDLTSQQPLLVDTSWTAYPAAHLAGFAAGVVCWGILRIRVPRFTLRASQPRRQCRL